MPFVPIRGLSTIGDIAKAAEIAQKAIGKTPGVGITLTSDSLDKLGWMERAKEKRNFRVVNDVLKAKLAKAFTGALFKVMRGKADVTEPWKAAGEAYRDHLAFRLANSGGDVKMKPLAPETIRRKGSSQIGRDTGALYRDVKSANVRITR